MKNFKALVLFAAIAVAMVGCAKLEKILPKGDGVWKATSETTVEYINNAVVSTTTTSSDSLPTYTFNSDGTGYVSYYGNTDTLSWTTNADGDQITLTPKGTSFGIVIDVLESKSKTQKWFYSFDYGNGDRDETTVELERQ